MRVNLTVFAKIFRSLYEGSLGGKTNEIMVFVNMLTWANRHGEFDRTPRSIASDTGLTIDQVNKAIAHLEAPDPESRTPDHSGRRIIRLDSHRSWGWRITNYDKYREIRNEENRREQNANNQRICRSKKKNNEA